jgi:hypothetical protein
MEYTQEEETLDQNEFYCALGWSGELTTYDVYSKKYSSFFIHSSIRGRVFRIYVDTFIERRGIGLVLANSSSELQKDRPDICCINKGSRICMDISMRNRIKDTLKSQKENFGYLAAPDLYRSIWKSWELCCLLDYAVFNYILFILVEDQVIEFQKSESGINCYRLCSAPKKRGRGRPPKVKFIL